MELLAEILLEVYFELLVLFIPEDRLSHRHRILAKVVAVIVFLGTLALAFWGACLILTEENPIGILPISIAVAIALIQIIGGILLYRKHNKS